MDIITYSIGITSCSVCADNNLSIEEIVAYINETEPTEIDSKWEVSKDKKFKSGEANPCECDKFPNERKHYLLNC